MTRYLENEEGTGTKVVTRSTFLSGPSHNLPYWGSGLTRLEPV